MFIIVNIIIFLYAIRQYLIYRGIKKSISFLNSNDSATNASDCKYNIICIIPMLREAKQARDTIEHFLPMLKEIGGKLLVVTTEKENYEKHLHQNVDDTYAIITMLKKEFDFIHLHFMDIGGVKSDQVNWAINTYFSDIQDDASRRTFCVVYDADSRPPLDTFHKFLEAINNYPKCNIFHQSARFEVPHIKTNVSILSNIKTLLADSSALRYNRFSLGIELARLLRYKQKKTSTPQRPSYTYTNITGHGLCIRCSYLLENPLPAQTAMEDLFYSFILCSHGEPMIPISSLDCSDVPISLKVQFKQLTRWFAGPARFGQYFRYPATKRGINSIFIMLSAALITVEWLVSVAIIPFFSLTLFYGTIVTRLLIAMLFLIVCIQLLTVECFCKNNTLNIRTIFILLLYPIIMTLFGLAGVFGMISLLHGDRMLGKTE
jgi:cellulose synthase/poly-beta-1,6-N-acetylglucosamine synthase-like glycosyltransferase